MRLLVEAMTDAECVEKLEFILKRQCQLQGMFVVTTKKKEDYFLHSLQGSKDTMILSQGCDPTHPRSRINHGGFKAKAFQGHTVGKCILEKHLDSLISDCITFHNLNESDFLIFYFICGKHDLA